MAFVSGNHKDLPPIGVIIILKLQWLIEFLCNLLNNLIFVKRRFFFSFKTLIFFPTLLPFGTCSTNRTPPPHSHYAPVWKERNRQLSLF